LFKKSIEATASMTVSADTETDVLVIGAGPTGLLSVSENAGMKSTLSSRIFSCHT
jgi:hypothetical protein